MSEKDIVRMSLYLSRDLKERIQNFAKSQNRTMNEVIIQFCEDSFGREPIEETIKKIIQRLERLENKK